MPVHLKTALQFKWQALRPHLRRPWVLLLAASLLLSCVALVGTYWYFYAKYERIVDDRIRRPIFNEPAQIYAAADRIEVGDQWKPATILANLRQAGYISAAATTPSNLGTFSQRGATIQIKPGPSSYHPGQNATLHFEGGQVDSITGPKGESLSSYELEPQLVTGLFDAKQRSKRRLLAFKEIPPLVTNAIVSVEDRRFFEHGGINYVRLVEGALTPLFRHRRMQGGSTLTMQMARGFFLSNERSIHRKVAEMTIALILERRFSKEQILEIYVNQVDLGQRGSFNIRGFGEAAQAYFGKDIKSLSLPEAALLAGLVNGPTYFSPFRHTERAIKRRNLVLQAMFDNHVVGREALAAAKAAPLKLAPPSVEADDAPYYIDLVRERLLAQYDETDLNSGGMRVYTALDRRLQAAAAEAIQVGMRQVDAAILRRRTRKIRQGKGKNATVITEVAPGPMPQVALIALDPHTGEVLALSGGRDYAASQLNHVVAKRPTGSIFKPFVYAAAISTALTGDPAKAFTQTSMLDANEGTFDFNGKPYSPRNFDPKDTGEVTARFALAHSINTATIRLAEMIGYDKVVQLAQSAGIKDLKPTPAMAIGAYDSTALDMAGAYTIFANNGVLRPPMFIRAIRGGNADEPSGQTGGENTESGNPTSPDKNNLLDSRVAFVLTDMMTAVLDGGTASAVRARFNSPAAGKTGSSHDAWFAGYTSNLLCVVWVGNDDYTDIKIEGAKAAAPIWTEFMLRARKLRRYADMQPFTPPAGVLPVHLDKLTNLPADDSCPDDYDAFFIDGTIPAATCDHPEGPSRNLFQKMFGIGLHRELVLPPVSQPTPANPPPPVATPAAPGQPAPNPISPTPPPTPEIKEKKRGFWKRIFGGKKNTDNKDAPTQQP